MDSTSPKLNMNKRAASPPNVIFVITDDQGYGDIACHNNPILKTLHLDRMARESVQLEDHHHDPLCSPSRAALLTGQYASRNGVWHVIEGRHLLDPSALTMADVFSANGYRAAIFGKWHLGDNYPFAPRFRGFEHTLCHRGGGIGELPDYWGNSYFDDHYFQNGKAIPFRGYCTDIFFEEAMRFIESNAKQPFFVHLATNAMHAPHIVPAHYSAPYKALGIPEDRASFYGMIANFDENMGRLFSCLRALNLEKNTIVIFTSDHGTAAGCDPVSGEGYNAGMRGKKGSMYDGGHRVSFFLRWKNTLPAPKKIHAMTAHIDILPTLIDLCQLNVPSEASFDGMSLASLMTGDSDKPQQFDKRSVIIHLQPDQPRKWRNCVVLRGDGWRLVNGEELYHIGNDPGQERNVAQDYPRLVSELRRDYERWWESLEDAFNKVIAIPVGTKQENPVHLSARDWHPTRGRVPWRQVWIDDPQYDANGFWLIDVHDSATYEIELRAYPREADFPAAATLARLQINGAAYDCPCHERETSVTFQLRLCPGIVKLQTWLSNRRNGRERGAYYVAITRIAD